METSIKNLSNTTYNGVFEIEAGDYTLRGRYVTDTENVVQHVNGMLFSSEKCPVASFSAHRAKDSFRYGFNRVGDISKIAEISEAVTSAVESMCGYLANEYNK